MNDKKINRDFLQGEELPAPILPTAIAWKDMQQRLDKEQPGKSGLLINDPGKDKAVRGRIVRGSALLLLFLLLWIVIQESIDKPGGNNISQRTSNDASVATKELKPDSKPNDEVIDNSGNGRKERNNISSTDQSTNIDNLSRDNNKKAETFIDNNRRIKGDKVSVDKKINARSAKNKTDNAKKKKILPKVKSSDSEIEVEQYNPTTKVSKTSNESSLPSSTDSIKNSLTGIRDSKKQPDSLQKTKPVVAEPEPQEKKHTEMEWGVHWTLQLPTGSAGQYFSGPTAGSQPYRILLPGLWLNFRMGKSIFQTEVNPFASAVLPARSFGTFTSSTTNVDTIITTTETKTLRKIFGISGSVGYAYNISGNWWLGTSIQAYWWRKAIATTKGEEIKQRIGSSSQAKRTFNGVYAMDAVERGYFNKLQMINSFDLTYRLNSSQAMLRVGITPLPFSKKDGPGNPFRAEFVYKLALSGKKKPGPGYQP